MLFLTRTTLNVPSLMGAIMSIGVATANSVLVITLRTNGLPRPRMPFARPSRRLHAAEAGDDDRSRDDHRMVPMALGLGEGGEQNAPLGRAVIGGLLFATIATLFFVPVVFAVVRGHKKSQDFAAENS